MKVYALKTTEGYLAEQGRETWTQPKPDGWALCTSRQYVEYLQARHGGEIVELEA